MKTENPAHQAKKILMRRRRNPLTSLARESHFLTTAANLQCNIKSRHQVQVSAIPTRPAGWIRAVCCQTATASIDVLTTVVL